MAEQIKIGGRLHSIAEGNVVTGANEILDDSKGKKQSVVNQETDAELERLNNAKQDNLTFDTTPTEGSTNPITSGGVYAADEVLQQAIAAILLLIPSAASALNQLADKNFVNSTVATDSATFRGTYNVVTDLELHYDATHQQIATALLSKIQTADNNDYCFVQIPLSDSSGDIRVTERYKFNGTVWSYEYDLNNSGFTAAQWAAINSTITQALVEKLGALPTAADLAIALNGKQNTLTFDTAPVAGSNNPVTSGGLYAAFAAINATIPAAASADNKLVAETRLAEYVAAIINALDATYNVTSTDGHVNVRLTQVDGVITSLEVLTSDIASAADVTALTTRVSTNEGDIAQLQAAYEALTQSTPVIVEPTDTWPVAAPQEGVIYRVIDRVNTPPQYYEDYMYNGTAMVLMGHYNNAIDAVPTAGSHNLVESGGVQNELALGAVYDVSAKNPTSGPNNDGKWESLSALLSDANLNTIIPTSVRKGGMSIKFIQSSDNKYVQARLMANTFTTDVTKWQTVDIEPIASSKNLVESGGVAYSNGIVIKNRYVNSDNDNILTHFAEGDYSIYVKKVNAGEKLIIYTDAILGSDSLAAFTSADDPLSNDATKVQIEGSYNIPLQIGYNEIIVPSTATYIAVTLQFGNQLGVAENKIIAMYSDFGIVEQIKSNSEQIKINSEKVKINSEKVKSISSKSTTEEAAEFRIEDVDGNAIISVGEHNTARDEEEVIFCDNESEGTEYAKIGNYGVKALDYHYLDGTPVLRSEFYGKRILFFGDSLVAASTPPQHGPITGFVELIAAKNYVPTKKYRYVNTPSNDDRYSYGLKNIAKDGTTLRVNGEGDSVVERVHNWVFADSCDVAVIQGGTNDFNVAKGTISQYYDVEFDTATTIGALEDIFKHCNTLGVKVCFLIMPKVAYMNDNYFDDCKQVCQKWGIPYLDLIHSAGFYMSYENEIAGEMYSIYTAVEYDNTETYMIDDKVRYNGGSYKCKQNNVVGILPTDTSYWTKTSNSDHDFCHLNDLGHKTIANKVEQFIKSI